MCSKYFTYRWRPSRAARAQCVVEVEVHLDRGRTVACGRAVWPVKPLLQAGAQPIYVERKE